MFIGLLLTLACASCIDAALGYLRFGKPGLLYLWMPYPGFDFVAYTLQFPYLHTTRFFTLPVLPWVYPAPAIFVLYPFFKLAAATNRVTGLAVFTLVTLIADGVVAWRFGAALTQRGLSRKAAVGLIVSTAIVGWPLYFSLQRGNIESLLWIGIAYGVLCFAKERYAAAATLFGIVGSVKLYPLLFLALLLKPGRYREIGLGIGVAVAVTLAGLRFLNPDVGYAWRSIATGIQRWTAMTTSVYPATGIGTDHSALGLLRQCTHGAILHDPNALHWYLGIAAAVTSAVFFSRIFGGPRPNQVLFVACATVLLPPTSFDYTLVSILIPWGWIAMLCVEQARARESVRRYVPFFALSAVTLAPLSFLHSHGGSGVYVEGPARAVALLALMVFAALVPLPENGRIPSSLR